MAQYIDKATVIAEIERISYETNYEPYTDEVIGKRKVCKELMNFLDTIEVKDMEESNEDKHWQDVRERSAIAAMQGTMSILGSSDRTAFRDIVVEGFRGNKKTYPNEIAEFSVACADSLIEELKKGSEEWQKSI